MTPLDPFVPWITGVPRRGEPRPGALSGVRLAVKDVIDIAGLPTGAGHPRWLATHPPATRDADAVDRLRAAGAVVVGKNHTDELAWSVGGTNQHYGAVENPAAPGHVCGGSSSGTAAAVAAGRADLGLGTDTAGSIRVPASYTGILGLRPTHSRVSRNGLVPLAPSFDVPGLLTRDLTTLRAAAGCVLSGTPGPDTPTRLLLPPDLWSTVPATVRDALAPAVRRLETGLPSDDRTPLLEAWDQARAAFATVQAAEAWQSHGEWIRRERPTFGPGVGARFEAATRITPDELTTATEILDRTRGILLGALDRGAVLAIPSTPDPAPALGSAGADRAALLRFTCLAGIAGVPAISLPVATVHGLPIGLSLIAAPWHDEILLDLAAWCQHR